MKKGLLDSSGSIGSSGSVTHQSTQRHKRHESKLLKKHQMPAAKRHIRVLDSDGNDVTPQALYHAPEGELQAKAARSFSEAFCTSGSGSSVYSSNYTMPSFSSSFLEDSRQFSHSAKESWTRRVSDSPSHYDKHPLAPPGFPTRTDKEKQRVTEEMLDDFEEIHLSETHVISLLNIPSTIASTDAEDADTLSERNNQYVELCRNKVGNDMYVERDAQSIAGNFKNKMIQTDTLIEADKDTTVTEWRLYDAFSGEDKSSQSDESHRLQPTVTAQRNGDSRGETSTSSDAGSTISSQPEISMLNLDLEQKREEIFQSEIFRQCLMVMERHVMANIQQTDSKLLPDQEDPNGAASPGCENVSEKDKDTNS